MAEIVQSCDQLGLLSKCRGIHHPKTWPGQPHFASTLSCPATHDTKAALTRFRSVIGTLYPVALGSTVRYMLEAIRQSYVAGVDQGKARRMGQVYTPPSIPDDATLLQQLRDSERSGGKY